MSDLNSNELEAMRILWEGGSAKPAEIQEQFGWPIENATLRSVLRLLVDKGYAKRRKKGKTYYYRAASTQRGVLSRMTRRMAQVFSGGSPADLIAQLIKSEKLTPEEIEEIRKLAEEKALGGKRS